MKKLLVCLLAIALTAGVAQADFFDDFEDGDASDWDLLSPGGSVLTWAVEAPGAGGSDYSLNQKTGGYSFPTDPGGAALPGSMALAPGVHSDAGVDVDFRIRTTAGYPDAGIVFGYQDADNFLYYLDVAVTGEHHWTANAVVNGTRTEIAETLIPIVGGATDFVHLEHSRDAATGYFKLVQDGVTVFDQTDPLYIGSATGRIGACANNDPYAIDNVVIPEPMTMTLLGIGSLVLLRRRRV